MRSRRAATVLLALAAAVPLGPGSTAGPPASADAAIGPGHGSMPAVSYQNPVTKGVVDTFPDPAMIRGKDGSWYAYGTTNPIFNSKGESGEHILPILRSADMVTWKYVGDVYGKGQQPSFWPANARAWAPDIRYVDGRYYLTYGLSSGGIALATSDRPTGPWTDRGLVVPSGGSGCPTFDIDQAMFTDTDGTHYLYWGSYDTICVSEMNAEATALVGEVTQVAQGRRAEGGLVLKRDGYYYLMMSDAGCCDGEFSGYTVKVGRSDNPRGPFVTQEGQPLMDRRSKGGIVATANGNGWAGTGHNTIQTDLSGQDWLAYHAIPTATPNFPPVDGATGGTLRSLSRRPMLIDRLDWIDGWPVLRSGEGPSTGPRPGPVTAPVAGSTFNDGQTSGWKSSGTGRWTVAAVTDAGGVASQTESPAQPALYLSTTEVTGDLRVEGDLRMTAGYSGAVGLVVADRGPRDQVVAWLDRGRNALVVSVTDRGRTTEVSAVLPGSFDHESWHTVAAELRGTRLEVDVSPDRLRDPLATVTTAMPSEKGNAKIGAASVGAPGQADNLSATRLYKPVTERAPDPKVGPRLPQFSDEFNGTGFPEANDPAWSWVRGEQAGAVEGGGSLTWPTQAAELAGGSNTASVLLRDAPTGDFVVETKLTFDGTRPAQQAGILMYEDDNRYLKLVHSVLPLARVPGAVTHQTEFGKEAERPTTVPPTPVFNGPMFGGPPAETTWLRLAYRLDRVNNEHDVRMATSTDGEHWAWGGSWSLPVRDRLRIGLISMNATGAVGTFDYLRTYRLAPR